MIRSERLKLNFACDIDGCFLDIMPIVKDELSKAGYAMLPHEDFHIQTDPAMDRNAWYKVWKKVFRRFNDTKPYPGAVEFIETLHARSQCPVHFITARPHSFASHTHQMLRHYLDVPFTVSFANTPFTKLDFMNGTTVFVEDHPETCREMAAHGKFVFMPIREWNRHAKIDLHRGIFEIEGLADLAPHIDRMITR